MNHTPGPWSVDGIGGIQTDGVRDGYMVGSLEHRRIAVMHGGSSVPRNQRWANARLIAAAPDLLEACKKALALIESDYPTGWAPERLVIIRLSEELRAAIKKAKGED